MPPATSLSASFDELKPKRTMPPANCVSPSRARRPFAEFASAPAGTTTTGHGARLETSAEMLPRRDERGPLEPTTIIAAFSAAAAATSRSAGWPTSTSQPAPQSTSVASPEKRSRRSATALIPFLGAPPSTTRTNTRPRPSLLLKARAIRAAPLADSESSIPQMIEPAIEILLRSFLRPCLKPIEAAIGRTTHLGVRVDCGGTTQMGPRPDSENGCPATS
jgi:hypothetical protein